MPPDWDPMPSEIDERCKEVQDTWDDDTKETRRAAMAKRHRPKGWTPPIISVSEIRGAITDTLDNGGLE